MLGDWSCCVVVMLRCCLFCLVVAHAFSFKPGERPFQCPHCSSGYIQRASLQEHVKRKHQQQADSILPSASLPTTAQPTEKKLLACKYCQKGSHPPVVAEQVLSLPAAGSAGSGMKNADPDPGSKYRWKLAKSAKNLNNKWNFFIFKSKVFA